MTRGWRRFLEDSEGKTPTKPVMGFEKMRKEKRSVRGRTVDDWLADALIGAQPLTDAEIADARADGRGTDGLDATKLSTFLRERGLRRGRVIEVHKRNIFVAEEKEDGRPDTGLLWLCSVAKRHFQRAHRERNFVVVGDRILFEPDRETKFDTSGEPIDSDLPRGVIQHSFERTSRIARQDPMNPAWEHVMLANIDLVCIVASVLNPEVRWGLIDRFLVQAEMESLRPVIVLNKVDLLANEKLASPEFLRIYARRIEIYRQIGYEVIEVCALRPKKTPEAAARLREIFRGKLVGLCGHSGVGKSSILNLMEPEFEQVVDENSDIFYKGRHTTTYNSLLTLGIGAYAIDTPGIRSFAIEDRDAITLSGCFPEFRGLRCKFRECSHVQEPGCAIKAAVEQGAVSKERYRSYVGLFKGVSFREGEGDDTDAVMIADLKARAQSRDEALAAPSEEVHDPDDAAAQRTRAGLDNRAHDADDEDDEETEARAREAEVSALRAAAAAKTQSEKAEPVRGGLARRLAFLKQKAGKTEDAP